MSTRAYAETIVPTIDARSRSRLAGFATRHADGVGLTVLLLLTTIIAWDGLPGLRWIRRIDVVTFFIPLWQSMGEQLRAGHLPGWLPAQFGGAPLAGDPQSSWLYLPVMILFAIFPGVAAYKGLVLFYLLIGGLGSYFLARSFGFGVTAAVFTATAYEFTAVYPQTRCCPIFSSVAVFLPVAFLCVERSTKREDRLGRLGWWALAGFAASQFMTAWVGQGAYYGALALASFIVYRTFIAPNVSSAWRDRLIRCAMAGATVFAFALLLGAGGIWSKIDGVNESQLAGGVYQGAAADAAETPAWAAKEGMANLMSASARQGRYYMGGVVALLALMAIPLLGRRRHVPYFALFSIVVFILTLKTTPIHELFYLWPRFQTLHQHIPTRILLLLPLGLTMLAGASVDALLRLRIRVWTAFLVPIPFIVLWLTHHGIDAPARIETRTIVATGVAAAFVIALILGSRYVRDARWNIAAHLIAFALIGVAFIDPSGWNVIIRSVLDRPLKGEYTDAANAAIAQDYVEENGAVQFLKAQEKLPNSEPFRYFGYDQGLIWKGGKFNGGYYVQYVSAAGRSKIAALITLNQAARFDLQDLQGYNPIQNARYNLFVEALNQRSQNYHQANVLGRGLTSPLLDLLNARYIVVPREVPAGRPDLLHLSQRLKTVYSDDKVRILENPTAFPRAWIVHDAQSGTKDWVFDQLESAPIDYSKTVLLEKAPPPVATLADPSSETVDVTLYEPNRVRLRATATADGLLVLSEVYDPGWRAYVDGKRVDVYAADYALRAVPITAGDHTVELRYEPASLRIGFRISAVAAIIFLALLAVIGWRWFRRRLATQRSTLD